MQNLGPLVAVGGHYSSAGYRKPTCPGTDKLGTVGCLRAKGTGIACSGQEELTEEAMMTKISG